MDTCIVCGGTRYGRQRVDGRDYVICADHSNIGSQITVVAAARLAQLAERDKRIAELEKWRGSALQKMTLARNREADRADIAEERIARLEEALGFYAERQSWLRGGFAPPDAVADAGKRARQALADKGDG